MSTMYRQCLLKKKEKTQMAWIPEKFAHVGKCVKLEKEDGWVVRGVFSRSSEKYLLEHERDYKNQRSASDI